MLLRRFFDYKLAQTSYLVACQHAKVALVVDPNRDIDRYIDAAVAEGVRSRSSETSLARERLLRSPPGRRWCGNGPSEVEFHSEAPIGALST